MAGEPGKEAPGPRVGGPSLELIAQPAGAADNTEELGAAASVDGPGGGLGAGGGPGAASGATGTGACTAGESCGGGETPGEAGPAEDQKTGSSCSRKV